MNSRALKETFAILSMFSNARDLFSRAKQGDAVAAVAFPPLSMIARIDREIRETTKQRTLQHANAAKAVVIRITPLGYDHWNPETHFWFSVSFLKKVVNEHWRPHRDFVSMHEFLDTVFNVQVPFDKVDRFKVMADETYDRARKLGVFGPQR